MTTNHGNETQAHETQKVMSAWKGRTEGYRLVMFECKSADVVLTDGPEHLPYCMALESQMTEKHTDVNILRDFANGCDCVGIITPNETVKRRATALVKRRIEPQLREKVFVVTLLELFERPLVELVGQIEKGEDDGSD